MLGLMGRKIGMTQLYDGRGEAVPVTLIEVGPCTVTQVKTPEKDGYGAVQLGFVEKREQRTKKPVLGHFRKNGLKPSQFIREFRVANAAGHQVGQTLDASLFEIGNLVDVIGTSMGRGFQGTRKRHKFTGGRATHGCTTHDQPGSIGASAFPSRVVKGKRLPGHMGAARVTVKNLEVMAVDAEQNMLAVRGAVPGRMRGLLLIRPVGKNVKVAKPVAKAAAKTVGKR
jgi:large subunit ribosomal protein L3